MMKHFDPTGVVPLPAADAPDAEMLDGRLEAKTRGVPELRVNQRRNIKDGMLQPSKSTRNPYTGGLVQMRTPFSKGSFSGSNR